MSAGIHGTNLLDVLFAGIDAIEQANVANDILQFDFHVDIGHALEDVRVEPYHRQPVDRSVHEFIAMETRRHAR